MSLLSDKAIKHYRNRRENPLLIEPFLPENLQPCSYDLTIGTNFISVAKRNCKSEYFKAISINEVREQGYASLSVKQFSKEEWANHTFLLEPGTLLLARTAEKVKIPTDLQGTFSGKSSLGRIGLLTHVTAGFIDPGFEGTITVELACVHDIPIWLHAGMKIGQISFMQLTEPCERPYGHPDLNSHYQNQEQPTIARF